LRKENKNFAGDCSALVAGACPALVAGESIYDIYIRKYMMKFKKFFIIAIALYPLICSAQTEEVQSLRVPFSQINIQPGKKMTATYSYKPKHQTLACTLHSSSVGAIFWKYNSTPQAITFPANGRIFLKSHPRPEGLLADPQGKIVIKSSRTNTSDLVVSCEYYTWG
jgi:hypothetical protein